MWTIPSPLALSLRPWAPPNERPSRSKVWEQVFGPSHEEHDRIIVERRRPSEHVDPQPADDAAQRRTGKTEQQPSDWHPDERAHEYLAPERGRNVRIAPRPPAETRFDAVYNPTHSKDITVHLEFDVVSDLDDEVEQFNRLVRQGDFANAKSFFDDHLVAHSAHPWIFVQYAEMLLEMGDYKSFQELNPQPVFQPLQSDASDSLKELERNWRLLKTLSLCYTQYKLHPITDELNRQDDIIPVPENMGSTEIRNVCLVMHVLYFADEAQAETHFPNNLANWGNWRKIYQDLLTQGRVWDVRDLLLSAYKLFGLEDVEEQFFESRDVVDSLLIDWPTKEEDDSTLLALLDIFVSMALDVNIVQEPPAFVDKCLRSASAIGESIMEKFPNYIKSRPFLQLILTQSSIIARRSKDNSLDFEYLLGFTGAASFPKHIGLPFYIPVRRENPGWVTSDMSQDSFQSVEMVLNASKEIKDYSTEALCLMELAVRRSNPSSIFDELARLQKDVQQDMRSYLTTCVSRYLIARDDDSKAKLLRDLNDLGSWQEPSNLTTPDRACAREIIQQALSPSNRGQQPRNSVHAGVRHYQWLPKYLQEFIDRHVVHPYSKPPRDDPYEETPDTIIIRHGTPPEPHGYNEMRFSPPYSPRPGNSRAQQRLPDEGVVTPKVQKVTEKPSQNRNHPAAPPSKALTLRPTVEEGYDSSDDGID
ncbi:hypothetical protein NM208_g2148 [Fusarium decemcellulare]|uniref:Uncharacterized protein n=1 Tax=Fusarium decemcellulare TaxID=57161 RepID=A0ACC1STK4_9HYPO|nr:hypothetical protein NM208_g2148 [Fusarium decemcellulare]